MRLALCLEYPLGLGGGVSVLVDILATELTRLGHEIFLVSPDTPESLRRSEGGRLVRGHFRWDRVPVSAESAGRLAQQLAEAGVQLAHFHLGGNYGWGNRFASRCPIVHLSRLAVPCVSTVHLVVDVLDGYCGPEKPAWFRALLLPLAWWGKIQQLRHVLAEVAVSRHDLRKLRRWYWPLRTRFVQIYHSRLRSGEPSPATTRDPVILNVGHLAWRKGQTTLVEAFAQLAPAYPQWTLQLAGHDLGDGAAQQISRIITAHQLEDRVSLLGQRDDALELMRRAAIYVQPSTAEALGLALQEAMFSGCACVGSRVGGIPELLQDGQTGRLFQPGNIEQLRAALEDLLRDTSQRETLGRAAAASIQRRGMTADSMVQRYLELYARIRSQ